MQCYDIANVLNSHDRGHDLGGAYSRINALGLWYGTGSSPSHTIPHYLNFLQDERGDDSTR